METNTYKMSYYCRNCGNYFYEEIQKGIRAVLKHCPLCGCSEAYPKGAQVQIEHLNTD